MLPVDLDADSGPALHPLHPTLERAVPDAFLRTTPRGRFRRHRRDRGSVARARAAPRSARRDRARGRATARRGAVRRLSRGRAGRAGEAPGRRDRRLPALPAPLVRGVLRGRRAALPLPPATRASSTSAAARPSVGPPRRPLSRVLLEREDGVHCAVGSSRERPRRRSVPGRGGAGAVRRAYVVVLMADSSGSHRRARLAPRGQEGGFVELTVVRDLRRWTAGAEAPDARGRSESVRTAGRAQNARTARTLPPESFGSSKR